MTDTQSPKWHMRLDKNGALVSADAPLLQLHIDAGGSDNGILALPELLTMADHCQRLQMTLTLCCSRAPQYWQSAPMVPV